jgi:hypothetical protein
MISSFLIVSTIDCFTDGYTQKTASARLHFNTSAFSLQEFAIDTHHRTSAQKQPDKRIKYRAQKTKRLSGCLKNVSSRK